MRFAIWFVIFVVSLTSPTLVQAQEVNDEVLNLITELVTGDDKDLRALGLDQIRAEAPGEAATAKFVELLGKVPADAIPSLIVALGDRGDKTAREGIVKVLEVNKTPEARAAVIRAIGMIGKSEDVPLLVSGLQSADKNESNSSAEALTKLTNEGVVTAIGEALSNSTNTPLRVKLIEIIGSRRAFEAVPLLLKLAIGKDAEVRKSAMGALGQLGSEENVPAMLDAVLVAEKGTEREAAEKAIMNVCARIKPPESRGKKLVSNFKSRPAPDRLILIATLGRVGGPDCLKMVEAYITDKDTKKHETGVKALCNWPDASVAPRLIELIDSESKQDLSLAALRGLIRVSVLADERTDAERLALLQEAMGLCKRDSERLLVIQRAKAIRTVESLRYVITFLDNPTFAQQACESIVELAHLRWLRDANKAEFHAALDRVLATSKDAVVKERAERYKNGQTWTSKGS